ncbi:osmotically inducible protein OsmC [Neobacillus niacini]|uniref:organic hydroperoxide resistance protein n=1 Tax=Neobacillus driksii TaxID=3035913 RepID=UPI0027874AEC|nr:organic hydroperoxide resistance protein [Neobacillus niacini]MDQ0970424.1 osmotically inducible protein OsmC [Neobacillus niacini]
MSLLFTSRATTQGGRQGRVKSDDGIIDLNLVMPSPNNKKEGSNPEQLFAAGYSACFDGALNLIARKNKHKIESSVTAAVSLLKDGVDDGFKIGVVLHAHINGVSQEVGEQLVKEAHEFCPYSKATRGNIEVSLETTVE